MFLKTIKSKILFIILISFLFSTACTFIACLIYYNNNKTMANKACDAVAENYATGINSVINRLLDFSRNLAISGETFYNSKDKDHDLLDESVSKAFKTNDNEITFGGGLWYEPYVINPDQKRFCTCADYDKENGCSIDPYFEGEQYDYLSRIWYTSTKSFVTQKNTMNISRPYLGATKAKELMITICTGLFNNNGEFIGMASVDWVLDAIIKKLEEIHLTENTFVLFANRKYDYILFLNYEDNDIKEKVGKPLSEIEWYSDDLKNETKFVYEKEEYICFVNHLFGDFVLCINVPTRELYYDLNKLLKTILIIFLVSIVLSLFILYRVLSSNIEKPIQYLVEKATEYASGHFDIKFDIKSSIEFSVLASTFNNMAASIKEHLSRLAIVNAAKKSIEAELNIAKKIQISNLKRIFPAYPDKKEFDIFATMVPAKAVGGDFYDFFFLDDRHFVFLIADVSDKGVPAALFMMEAKGVIKNSIERNASLKDAIENVNKALYKTNDTGFFVTAFIAVLDIRTGLLEYVNAGHNKPLLKLASSEYNYIETKGDVVIGAFENVKYNSYKVQLSKNSALFLYTDGITEAQNKNKEFFGEQRLKDATNEFDSTARENVDTMMKKVRAFCNGNEQYDDMTMLNLIYSGNDKVETNEIVVDATKDKWSNVYDFLAKDMTDKKIEKDRKLKILLAAEELFVNIASYAYEKDGKAWIKTEKTDTTYDISFIDTGKQYNPLEKKDPNVDISLEDRTEGGLGVYLVKKLVDEVIYRYENSQNIFTISINL